MKRPAFQFYPADWRNDAGLKLCSLSARGLWIEMICIMHAAEPYGHLCAAGRPLDARDLSKLVGESERDVKKWLEELVRNNVCSSEGGAIVSRRMVRDESLRERRAAGGEAGSEFGHLGAEHGKKGGRPRKDTGDKKPPFNPPPSSSSSSSSSEKERDAGEPAAPAKPSRSSRSDKTLKTYIDECRAAGVKPIPDDHPVRRYCESAGITADMAALAWLRFREEHTIGTRKAKRYTDWPATFANSVKDRWYKFWIANAEGDATWTSEGLQARRVVDAQRHPEPEAA